MCLIRFGRQVTYKIYAKKEASSAKPCERCCYAKKLSNLQASSARTLIMFTEKYVYRKVRLLDKNNAPRSALLRSASQKKNKNHATPIAYAKAKQSFYAKIS